MLYSTSERISGQALVLPLNHFANDADGFLYRVNPFMRSQCKSLAEFAEAVDGRFFDVDDYQDIVVDGTRNASVDFGPIVVIMANNGISDAKAIGRMCEGGLNIEMSDYIAEIVLHTGTKHQSTSYNF